ncbi:MAG: wax ester/triacylglycerol synthase family O-acyltransferase [Deltaproteobacteria bacterium]|nr:wax ester/triacylglycerol synthase family O-acyltransferase [Deltaproteobacteria bacterium]
MAARQLSSLDSSFLDLETPTQCGHVGSLAVYEAGDRNEKSLYPAVRRALEARVPDLAPLRRKLVPVPFGLDHPYWMDDANFDLDFHLRHIAVPSPGDSEQLASLVARIHGRPLDRSKPLWEQYVIEGFEETRTAVYTKLHHCAIDGVAGVELTTALSDTNPHAATTGGARPRPLLAEPSIFEMLARGMIGMVTKPARLAAFAMRAADNVARTGNLAAIANASGVGALARALGAGHLPIASDLLGIAPMRPGGDPVAVRNRRPPQTPFNRPITPQRRYAFTSLPLDDVRRVKKTLGCTVNDVVLAICSHALRRYLTARSALPEAPLVAIVPVSVRASSDKSEYGNHVTTVLSDLATDIADPLARLRRIQEAMSAAKAMKDVLPADMLEGFTRMAAFLVAGRGARVLATAIHATGMRPPFNVAISNVPGPREALYLGGARMTALYPVSNVAEGQGLNITVVSYLDRLNFGLVACRDLVPDLDDLTDGLHEGLEALATAVAHR